MRQSNRKKNRPIPAFKHSSGPADGGHSAPSAVPPKVAPESPFEHASMMSLSETLQKLKDAEKVLRDQLGVLEHSLLMLQASRDLQDSKISWQKPDEADSYIR